MTKKQIESQLKKNNKERIQLLDELDELRRKKELPALKQKYEGKYFKYKNSYDAESNWFIYIYCKKVIDVDQVLTEQFECEPRGEWTFQLDDISGLWILQTEITQKEYDKAAINFISAAQTIMQLKEEPNDTRRNKKSKA